MSLAVGRTRTPLEDHTDGTFRMVELDLDHQDLLPRTEVAESVEGQVLNVPENRESDE